MIARPTKGGAAARDMLVVAFACANLFSACRFISRGGEAKEPRIFSEPLRAAVAEPQRTLKQSRKGLALADGVSVRDCSSYLTAIRAGGAVADTTQAQAAAADYLVCDAIDALRCAEGLGNATIVSGRGQQLADRLDLRQISSSLGSLLDETNHTLSQLEAAVNTSETVVTVSAQGQKLRFEIAAEADVNGDGKTDWIVWLADYANDGSYRGYGTLLIPSPSDEGTLSASAWPASGSTPCKALEGPKSYR